MPIVPDGSAEAAVSVDVPIRPGTARSVRFDAGRSQSLTGAALGSAGIRHAGRTTAARPPLIIRRFPA